MLCYLVQGQHFFCFGELAFKHVLSDKYILNWLIAHYFWWWQVLRVFSSKNRGEELILEVTHSLWVGYNSSLTILQRFNVWSICSVLVYTGIKLPWVFLDPFCIFLNKSLRNRKDCFSSRLSCALTWKSESCFILSFLPAKSSDLFTSVLFHTFLSTWKLKWEPSFVRFRVVQ